MTRCALFGITPDYDLDIMTPGQTLSGITSAVLQSLDPVLKDFRPDWVLVQGDTTTTMAAALAAFYRKIAVGHVEAGLRTGDLENPWPEEANRRIATVVSTRHYCPTERARQNLLNEGVDPRSILVTGNTVDRCAAHDRRRDQAGPRPPGRDGPALRFGSIPTAG